MGRSPKDFANTMAPLNGVLTYALRYGTVHWSVNLSDRNFFSGEHAQHDERLSAAINAADDRYAHVRCVSQLNASLLKHTPWAHRRSGRFLLHKGG